MCTGLGPRDQGGHMGAFGTLGSFLGVTLHAGPRPPEIRSSCPFGVGRAVRFVHTCSACWGLVHCSLSGPTSPVASAAGQHREEGRGLARAPEAPPWIRTHRVQPCSCVGGCRHHLSLHGSQGTNGRQSGARWPDTYTPQHPGSLSQQHHLLGDQGRALKAPCHQKEQPLGNGRRRAWASGGPCPDRGVVGDLGHATQQPLCLERALQPMCLAFCEH